MIMTVDTGCGTDSVPLVEDESYRAETLVYCPALRRLDKDDVGEEEREEAAQTRKSRRHEVDDDVSQAS